MSTVVTPNGRRVDINYQIADSMAAGEDKWHWYRCAICAGGDPRCGYCYGSGYWALTTRERRYYWIDDAITHWRRTWVKGRWKHIRRIISRPLRALADRIYDEEFGD